MKKSYTVRELLELICIYNENRIVDVSCIQEGIHTGDARVLLKCLPEHILDSDVYDFFPDAELNKSIARAPYFVIAVNDL